jgi:Metallo-peptidase family M12
MKNLFSPAYMRAVIFMLTLYISANLAAQVVPANFCGSVVTPSYKQYYSQLLLTPPVYTPQSTLNTTKNIPLHFWIIQNDAGTNFATPTTVDIDSLINKVNPFFNFPNGEKFKRCGVTYIKSNNFTIINTNARLLNTTYYNCDALNVYVVENIVGAWAFANFPVPSDSTTVTGNSNLNNMIAINSNILLYNAANYQTFAHELGHSFGLLHTFEGASDFTYTNPNTGQVITIPSQNREQVNRSILNCGPNRNGDQLCDTPADYGPNGQNAPTNLQGSCGFTAINCSAGVCLAKDDAGVQLSPDFTNFMSYYSSGCTNHFSNEQQLYMNRILYTTPARLYLLRGVQGIVEKPCPAPTKLNSTTVNLTLTYNSTSLITCQPYSTTTSTMGEYYSCGLNTNNSITATATKNTDVYNGVSTYDIQLIQTHILGITNLSDPYQLIAADVDNNSDIDAADILYIRNLILRRISTFPNNVESWRFVPKLYLENASFSAAFNANPFAASIVYKGIARAYAGVNSYLNSININMANGDPDAPRANAWSFNAIKTGDVNCNANAANTLRMAQNQMTNLDSKAVSVKSGKEATVLIKAKYAGKISTFQAGFNFTNSALQITSIEKGDFNSSNDVMDYIKQDNGEIRTLWYNDKAKAKNFTAGVTVMKLKIKALKDIADLLAVLSLDNAVLQSEFYDDKNLLVTMPLTLEADGSNTPISNDSYSVKVYPNPFSNTVTLEVTSATKENATVAIASAMGAPLYNKKVALEVGVNTITIENTSTFPTGVLSYNIQFGSRTLNGTINKSR